MKRLLLVSAVLSTMGTAQAGVLDDGNLSISGFGTLGAASSNTDKVQFARYNQAEGITDKIRIGLDTNLGLQATYKFNDQLSGTAQILTRKNTSPTFTTDLTWAFLKYKINDELSARAGRVALPIFMISDYQNVGYANTMMRPPIEMYGQAPLENADGADLNYQHSYGDTNFTAQGVVGVSRGKLFIANTNSVATYRAPVYGMSLSAEHGPLTVRLSHVMAELSSNDIASLNSLTGTLGAVGFGQLGADIAVNKKKIGFTALGAVLDWNNLLVQAEYGQRRAKDKIYIADNNSWYLMAGYRFGKILPYYTHASVTTKDSSISLPAGFPASGALSAGVRGLLQGVEQDSDLIGVRWDFAKSAALKVQVDRAKPKAKNGMLVTPAAVVKDTVTVIGASLDFVF